MTDPPPAIATPSHRHPQPSPISAMASPAATPTSKKGTALLNEKCTHFSDRRTAPPNTATAE